MTNDVEKINKIIGKGIATAVIAGALATVFTRCTTHVSETEAFCWQTGPSSFEIIAVQPKPHLLWDVEGSFDNSGGIENRKLVRAFVNRNMYKGDPYYATAEMDLEKKTCGIFYWASNFWPIASNNEYKLVNIN